MNFLEFRLIDLIDIVVVAVLLYRLYWVIKGTVAQNIFIGLFAFMVFWLTIKALHMELLTTILNNFVNVGVLALIIVFQQEIRRFFLMLGSKYKITRRFSLDKLFSTSNEGYKPQILIQVSQACKTLSAEKQGALIIFVKSQDLLEFVETGILLNAKLSTELLRNIFAKNTPLHDGAVIIFNDLILSACSILPISRNEDVPQQFGLRHRAALGITESSDAVAIVVSEETGSITVFKENDHYSVATSNDLLLTLESLLL